ncbi:MAG: ATP-dependent sacrificial sulfur transferase LarE [Thermaerobacter sp.]|nr:ATP-dependent sacrificial sulfur transferase LarE [Thermaerobacter sp.]
MEDKEQLLRTILRGFDGAVVAFSGGVDSSLLLSFAVEELGGRVLAATAVSETLPPGELDGARLVVRLLGARHRLLETAELSCPEFAANTPRRCYHCKRELFGRLREVARAAALAAVLDGTNADDARDWRPGRDAARELGVRSPLLEAGLTKEEIRALARRRGLPNWDKPAEPCLSSRIPYGTPITPPVLEQVRRAETYLKSFLPGPLRVRHHGELARLELGPAAWETASRRREEIHRALRELGYTYVTLDLAGYRPGSLNETI